MSEGEPTSPAHADDLGFELPPPARGSRVKVAIGLALVVGVEFELAKSAAQGRSTSRSRATAPRVRVELVTPTVLSTDRALTLPGTVRPLEETQPFARANGYVRAWHADLGDKVKTGQVLAELDTPELAAELSQGRAQLASARAAVKQALAQRELSKANSARFSSLADQQLVSKAQVEEARARAATDEATFTATEANVDAMTANVRRLVDLQAFSKIVAPFAGTITTRTIERGALVQVGGTVPMFTLVATDPVRIFLDVPQTVAPGVKPDTPAQVTVREYGDRVFAGKVARSSGALDEELHTMRTEVRVPNADGALMPGMYVQVAISLATPHHIVELPSTALFSDADGLRVATVDPAGRVKLVKITIERDTGATLQIATGLTCRGAVIKLAVHACATATTSRSAPAQRGRPARPRSPTATFRATRSTVGPTSMLGHREVAEPLARRTRSTRPAPRRVW